jgi:long-chain fatty acid transport protein
MGGASTAAPISPLSAMYWNPATISGMQNSGLEMGMDLLYSNQTLSSSVGPFSGTTKSENGFFPVPNIAWVHQTSNPAVTFGLGMNAIAGFKTNLKSSSTNPVLLPQPAGLGLVSSEASFLQIAPVLSVAMSDRLSFAAGPTITTGEIGVEPYVFAAPNNNGQYAEARATRYSWGGGAQAGVYYIANDYWRFGASFKTKQWMEPFRFFSTDAVGADRLIKLNLDLPTIVSFGTAYQPTEKWLFAFDIRYFDFKNSSGLGDAAVYNGDGSLGGLGWRSAVATALGIQYQWSERVALRGGYSFNESPIKKDQAFFNTATPLYYQHMLSSGAGYALSKCVDVNLAYSYMLPAELNGPINLPGVGNVPGSNVRNSLDVHFLSFGAIVKY